MLSQSVNSGGRKSPTHPSPALWGRELAGVLRVQSIEQGRWCSAGDDKGCFFSSRYIQARESCFCVFLAHPPGGWLLKWQRPLQFSSTKFTACCFASLSAASLCSAGMNFLSVPSI